MLPKPGVFGGSVFHLFIQKAAEEVLATVDKDGSVAVDTEERRQESRNHTSGISSPSTTKTVMVFLTQKNLRCTFRAAVYKDASIC
ncbi:hypothetical protein EGR_01061 [Echinococcus granulosus]|uniref:Uncharacterized protein n=1 Tax=Echinococcus granulosus TaxID=6210 RepID=W6URU4_ECHGR|nr:hypothetical protein EGR_01061 [Echinococcus granulosus]EUB63933.1 hypothetical protein EGR_01061 [Echinococcus granulosus]